VPFSLLHISDIHRSPHDPIGNADLIAALINDRDRYVGEDPSVSAPNAIIVSGDLVFGVPIRSSRPATNLRAQYAEAMEFLADLSDRFVDGDRDRVVIVPGNHDVDWNTARQAMRRVANATLPGELSPLTFGSSARLRWSWEDRRVYEIVDPDVYERRLAQFARAIAGFYGEPATNPTPDYRLFELNEGKIGVAAFNSCAGNDCYCFSGAISAEAISRAYLELREKTPSYSLFAAVWHHSMQGTPEASDYMDVASVYDLATKGFGLGMHGHQHHGEISYRYLRRADAPAMAVVAAGSLGAGPRELPVGTNRQYNVIELSDDLSSARIHVREMTIGTAFAPARRPEFGGASYVDMDIPGPSIPFAGTETARIGEAEAYLRGGNVEAALDILVTVDRPPNSYARTLLLQGLRDAGRWEELIAEIGRPVTVEELIGLVQATVAVGDYDASQAAIDEFSDQLRVPQAIALDLRNRVAAGRELNG
jgi:hypothetical protein